MLLRRPIILVVVLVVLVALGVWWRAVWVTRHLLRADAPASIAERSGNVYRVAVGRVRFNPLNRRVTVDTIEVTTNDATNAARPHPRAGLRLSFRGCAMSGVHVFKLIFRRGLIANTFGCSAVTAAVDVPRGGPDSTPRPNAPPVERAFFVLQQSLRLPASAPQVRVARIDFPQVALDFRLRNAGGEARLQLKQLRWLMSGFLVDPGDSTAAARPLFSDSVEIRAAKFVGQIDSVTAVTVDALSLSLSDSTLHVSGIAFASRDSLVRTTATRIDARGLDVGVFLLRQGVRARTVRLDSLRIDVFSDQRRKGSDNPRGSRRRTPQDWIADIERGIHLDTVVIRDGEVVYREQHPRHAKAGVLTFARLNAVATNVRHVFKRRTTADPLILDATAWLQQEGRLDARFIVPLDAPRFTMTFRGRLGAMRATGFNGFVEEALPWRFDKGKVDSIAFTARVTDGVARGTVVPRYKDLALAVTGKGSGGILGTGGMVGDAVRSVATFVGNETALRSDNPDDGATLLRSGTIEHAFTPDQTLPGFLWQSLRGGLLAVVKK